MNDRAVAVPVGVLLAVLALAGSGAAQDPSTYHTVTHPNEASRRLDGSQIDWKAFYDKATALTAEARRAIPQHQLNLPYGDDPKQRLDVYPPTGGGAGSRAPVFIFVHGGGFLEGDRAQYGYVAMPLATHGIITVVPSYRLTPQYHYPDQPTDTRLILAWVYRTIAKYGGDPDRIYIGGHSAGAILSAGVSLKTDWLAGMSLPAGLIKGCVPISGPYDLTTAITAGRTAYLPDPARRVEASPIFNVVDPPPSTVVAVGSVEVAYVASSKALVEKIRARGGRAELLVLEGLAHDETALALGREDNPLVRAILTMIERPGR